ncbi:MAG: uroporphyrinogen decarboxylase [Chloroflexi bacterium]|nr:uroporphyrinogen decarboxylase [Chloroflexota bacterium]
MTKWERMRSIMRTGKADRPAVSLWRHFPHDDLTPEDLAPRVVAFQKTYDFDFVKVTPAAGYPAEAWGAQMFYLDNAEGTRGYKQRPVSQADDWLRVRPLDISESVLAREIKTLELVRQELGDEVPVMQTIFSPLNVAKNLAGDRLVNDLREYPDRLHAALAVITQTMVDFTVATLKHGADSVFFATQMATRQAFTEGEFATFGESYDLKVLNAISSKTEMILLHIHGEDILFDRLMRYPVQLINWHDRRTPPSLKEAFQKFPGVVVGGLDALDDLQNGSPDHVIARAHQALNETNGERIVLGAGCVTMTTTPEANILAARHSVESF